MLLSQPSDTLTRRVPTSASPRHTARQAVLTLPSQEVSVPVSRHFADDLLVRWGIAEDERDSAMLVVDELVANAVQHGHADMTLLLVLDEDMLLIAVADSGPVVAKQAPRADIAPDEHGRGTGIVEFLALWTEIRDSEDGRRVRVGLRVTNIRPR